jgi:hypothetical protein
VTVRQGTQQTVTGSVPTADPVGAPPDGEQDPPVGPDV